VSKNKKVKEKFHTFKITHIGKPIAEFGFEYCHGCKMRFRCLFKIEDYEQHSILQQGGLWDIDNRIGISYSDKLYADILPQNKKITREFRQNFKCVRTVRSGVDRQHRSCIGLEDLLIKGKALFVKRIMDYYGRNE